MVANPIQKFWLHHRRRAIIALLIGQIATGLIVYSLLSAAGMLSPTLPSTALIILTVVLLFGIVNGIIMLFLLAPLRAVVQAIAHVSDEQTTATPPQPKDTAHLKTGLTPILEFLYALRDQSTAAAPQSHDLFASLQEPLIDAAVGFAALDTNGNVLFHTDAAPVITNSKGVKRLELEFYTEEPIDTWIADCEEHAVRADREWSRIPRHPAGSEDRTIYDLVASYRKRNAIPIVVFCINRTNSYLPEENDLNFIAFAAHELRGPITVIRGYLDTLVDEMGQSLTSEQRELFDRLTVSANRLAGYINNILNSARFDQRHLELHLREASLANIYASIADDMQLRAQAQHRLLSVTIPSELPTVAADASSISEVLSNLIDNALKYSNEGGHVQVTAAASEMSVTISVIDNGIGMPSNVVANLFHKFYRSHRSRETVAGTGIGLYISKAIIESHGGTMEVRSIEGKGSTFSFSIPLYAAVADKLLQTAGNNTELIHMHSGSWIKNHGQIRG